MLRNNVIAQEDSDLAERTLSGSSRNDFLAGTAA